MSPAATYYPKLMTPHESPPRPESSPAGPAAAAKSPWAVPVMWMVMVLLLVSGAVYIFKSCSEMPGTTLDRAGKVVATVCQQVQNVAAAFKQGNITTTFTSYATTISGSKYLQFATLSQHETFTRKDESND